MCSVSWRSFHCRRRSAFLTDELNRPVVSAVGITHARFLSAQLRGRFALWPRGAGLWITGRRRSYGTYSLCHATNFHPVTLVFVDAFRDPGHVGECRSQPGNDAQFSCLMRGCREIRRCSGTYPARRGERSAPCRQWCCDRGGRGRESHCQPRAPDRRDENETRSTVSSHARTVVGSGQDIVVVMRCDGLPGPFVASFAGWLRL